MYNLLSNAVKFTPDRGEIHIFVSLFRVNNRDQSAPGAKETGQGQEVFPQFVQVSIEDTGIGIKPEDLGQIFDPFEQVESSRSRRYQGTGLGLSLTRRLVKLHVGRIWSESEGKGKGSRFVFLLPSGHPEEKKARPN